ncbi:MAG TPA: hypothetical protein VIV40_21570 [Kofleriaceae bacterium]
MPADGSMCSICTAMRDQDALQITTLEILQTIHNACAPVTHYLCRCRTCETRWLAIEVFDEEAKRPSEWSWAVDRSEP